MSSNFTLQYQNSRTNWEWKDAPLLADTESFGIEFDDEFIVPDITPKHNFFTWTNFRILCNVTCDKINLWAQVHDEPDQLDLEGRKHQEGDAISTYADYQTHSSVFKNSDRLYFWIKATDQDDSYSMSQGIYDSDMAAKAVTLDDIEPDDDITDIVNWLGWDPQATPYGTGVYAKIIDANSEASDVARWIIGWDNSCVNVLSNVINPVIGFEYQAAILDSYRMINGLTGKQWLGCPENRYIYGKILYSLEDHDGPGELAAGNYGSYRLIDTVGFKSFQISISAIQY